MRIGLSARFGRTARLIVTNPCRHPHHLSIPRTENTTTEFSLEIALEDDTNNAVDRGNKSLTEKSTDWSFGRLTNTMCSTKRIGMDGSGLVYACLCVFIDHQDLLRLALRSFHYKNYR